MKKALFEAVGCVFYDDFSYAFDHWPGDGERMWELIDGKVHTYFARRAQSVYPDANHLECEEVQDAYVASLVMAEMMREP